jgi:integrase
VSFMTRPRHPVTGRRFYLRARTQRELEAYMHRLDTLRTELRLNVRTVEEIDRELRHLRHGPVTLERAAVSYLERKLADNTKRRVRSALDSHLRAIAALPIASLDAVTLQAWIRSVELTGIHQTSVRAVWKTLSAIVRHATERGWIGALPWGSWRPKIGRAPKRAQREATRTLAELRRLLEGARANDDEDRSYLPMSMADSEAKIAAASLLGLRQGELAGLRWDEVGWGPPLVVLVARQWENAPLKNSAQPRRIEAIEALAEILQRLRAHQERWGMYEPAGPVFPSRKSAYGKPRPYTRGQVLTSLQVRSAVNRAGLPHPQAWSAHSLRDSFVTLEAQASGGDLVRVASRSRHASLTSLVRYLRAVSRDTAPPAFSCLPGYNADGAPSLLSPGHDDRIIEKEPPP